MTITVSVNCQISYRLLKFKGWKSTFLLTFIEKKISLTFFLTSLSLYIFTIWKCVAYNRFCRDRIYFDKILVSEYKLFKRSNKANLFDIYFTEYGTALTTILPILSLYLNTVIVTAGTFEPLNLNESGRFGALKSDSTHHFFYLKRLIKYI
jgi:hypothetical protein